MSLSAKPLLPISVFVHIKKRTNYDHSKYFCMHFEKETKRNSERVYCILLGFIKCPLFLCAFLKSLLIFTKALEDKLDAEISQVDQKVVLELDQLVSDQQATLQVSQI